MKEYKRNCPVCDKELTYNNPSSFYTCRSKNTVCRSCGTKKQYLDNPNKNKGSSNGRFGKTLKDQMINKYGEEEAEVRYKDWKQNLTKFRQGKDNPAYGRNWNGGRSYKGYYKGLHFRSSLELLFIFKFEIENSFLPETAETNKFRVKYNNGKNTYVPDFYCYKCNTVYEIKVGAFLNIEPTKSKLLEGRKGLENLGYNYKVVTEDCIDNYTVRDCNRVRYFLKILSDKNIINLDAKSLERLNRYVSKDIVDEKGKLLKLKEFDSEFLNKIINGENNENI